MSSEQLDALERLARLKEQGMLTDQEFQKQKELILGNTPSTETLPPVTPIPPVQQHPLPSKDSGSSSGTVATIIFFSLSIGIVSYIIYTASKEDNKRNEVKQSEPGHVSYVAELVNKDEILKAKLYADSIIKNSEHKDKLGRLGLVRDTLLRATGEEHLQKTIISLRKPTIDSLKRGQKPKFFKNSHINAYFIKQVIKNLGNKKEYIELQAKREEILGKAMDRALASKYFKTGRNRDWERAIKSQLKDPDSFDHENTVYEIKNGYIYVTTKFRGKNSFGALEIGYAEGNLSLTTGTVISCKVSN
ncbi:SHOCT domain-containing protein [Siphonobacter sp. SORGH_AS_1065]|uniref:SHOCT domain-containing protein n=1 Tax=Siphonobacter sp. SORGH_AS_1065 TaxID=3041795 RepID=UPI0027879097|nr:SHOCT domain-containing protein [Siphonobacter sp. SORGH_AS_1065]MDQ1089036.1 hypothetical protein [Siphonobacter sp. SORGH_AS_1065]